MVGAAGQLYIVFEAPTALDLVKELHRSRCRAITIVYGRVALEHAALKDVGRKEDFDVRNAVLPAGSGDVIVVFAAKLDGAYAEGALQCAFSAQSR